MSFVDFTSRDVLQAGGKFNKYGIVSWSRSQAVAQTESVKMNTVTLYSSLQLTDFMNL